jgi:hypothetical protein
VPLKQKPWRHQRIRHVNEDRVHRSHYRLGELLSVGGAPRWGVNLYV